MLFTRTAPTNLRSAQRMGLVCVLAWLVSNSASVFREAATPPLTCWRFS